jgi:hypothetical protein
LLPQVRSCKTLLAPLLLSMNGEALPIVLPAIMADAGSQGEHRVDMETLPMHASAFETRLDHEFVGAFHHP